MADKQDFHAVVAITIKVPASRVWDGITRPALIKQYMHGTDTKTDWRVGSPITWSGEWNGQAYEDKGKVLALEPNKHLAYTHWSPLSGAADVPENYHVVTLDVDEKTDHTVLTLTQSNNPSQAAADKMAETAWKPMLEQLQKVLEAQG